MGALRAGKVMEATPVIETGSPSSLPPTVADVMVCTEGGPQAEAYTESRIGPYNLFFARKFAKLCRDHGTQVIALHIPVSGQENERVITECQPWSEVLGIHVDLIGIPGARLFAGIPQADAHKYFYEKDHLNGNGQDLFTPLITPSLINLYEHPNDQE
jgi:hypothetical protein